MGKPRAQLVTAIERLGRIMGPLLRSCRGWGTQARDTDGQLALRVSEAEPVDADMNRVAATMHAIDDIEAGRLAGLSYRLCEGGQGSLHFVHLWVSEPDQA